MNLLLDKCIIFILDIFAMGDLLHGKFAVLFFYLLVIYEALLVWLLSEPGGLMQNAEKRREIKARIAAILEIAFACMLFLFPQYAVLLPLATFNASKSKNHICSFLLPAVLISCATSGKVPFLLLVYVFVLSVLAAYLCRRTMKLETTENRLHRLRDDDALTKSELKDKQAMLAKSMEQEVYAAQLAERNRIARDIHDNVGHMLSRAILMTGAMMTVHGKEPVGEGLQALRETLDSAMNSIRASVHDLKDESVDLELALKRLAEPLREKFRLREEYDFRPVEDNEIKFAILGIVKESISNIIKYSKNDCVDLKVIEHPQMYQITVHDYPEEKGPGRGHASRGQGDGSSVSETHGDRRTVSLSPTQSPASSTSGMGLSNIRARAEELGGNCLITSDQGFRVFVTIPKE